MARSEMRWEMGFSASEIASTAIQLDKLVWPYNATLAIMPTSLVFPGTIKREDYNHIFSCSVYGHENRNSGWMIVKLDFSKILTEKCQDKDYTLWTPADQVGFA
jgi:hypothetical protein